MKGYNDPVVSCHVVAKVCIKVIQTLKHTLKEDNNRSIHVRLLYYTQNKGTVTAHTVTTTSHAQPVVSPKLINCCYWLNSHRIIPESSTAN